MKKFLIILLFVYIVRVNGEKSSNIERTLNKSSKSLINGSAEIAEKELTLGNKKRWIAVGQGQYNQLPYILNCSHDSMTIQINLSSLANSKPYIYLERLRSFSICRPKILKSLATFHLSLDNEFYRCGTTKVRDNHAHTQVFYNRIIVELNEKIHQSIYFKCSKPFLEKEVQRPKRAPSPTSQQKGAFNFTEIDLPENFMEAEVLDFTDNITARAPYPHLNILVKRDGRVVNTTLNVSPGTPLEMTIYLDNESKTVYGLLASFMKVTDNTNRQQEIILLSGCSIDPYIFGNFESEDRGDSITAKFRAFKFPDSNYVMFVGTVNVCLDQCKSVPCGNGIYGLGRRRRSIAKQTSHDSNKVFEIEMTAYLKIGYTEDQITKKQKDSALQGIFRSEKTASLKFEESQPNDFPKFDALKNSASWLHQIYVVQSIISCLFIVMLNFE